MSKQVRFQKKDRRNMQEKINENMRAKGDDSDCTATFDPSNVVGETHDHKCDHAGEYTFNGQIQDESSILI